MGSSQFCTVNINEQASELAIGMKETSQSQKSPNRSSKGIINKNQPLSPMQKCTHGQFKIDDPQTPVFTDLRLL